jgi:hypothetical protein
MCLFPDLNIQLIPHPPGKSNQQLSVDICISIVVLNGVDTGKKTQLMVIHFDFDGHYAIYAISMN